MDFTISEEVRSAQQLAQQILGDYTSVDKLKVIEKQAERFDTGLWQALAEAGLLGLDIGEGHGGTELGFYSLTTLCEEVGRTVAPVPVIPVLVSAAGTLRRFGSDTQKDQWLTGIASGATLITCRARRVQQRRSRRRRAAPHRRRKAATPSAAPRSASARRARPPAYWCPPGRARNWSWPWWIRAPPVSPSTRRS